MKRILQILLISIIAFDLNGQSNAGADIQVCQNDTVEIIGSGLINNATGFFTWRDISTNTIVSNDKILKYKSTKIGRVQYELKLETIINSQSSITFDSVWVETIEIPIFSGFSIIKICYDDGPINLSKNSGLTVKVGKNHSLTLPSDSIRFYQNKNPSWVTGGPLGVNPHIFDYKKFINNPQVQVSGTNELICYEYKDQNGCKNTECKTIKIYPSPVVELKSKEFCQQENFVELETLILKPVVRTSGIETFRCLEAPANSGINVNSIVSIDNSVFPPKHLLDIGNPCDTQKTGDYLIEYCFKSPITSCKSCDSIFIKVAKSYEVGLKNTPVICENSEFNLHNLIYNNCNNNSFDTSKWFVTEYSNPKNSSDTLANIALTKSIFNNSIFKPKKGVYGTYKLRVNTENSLCTNIDSDLNNLTINVIESPNLKINVPNSVCENEAPFKLINIEPLGKVGEWSGKGVFKDSFYLNNFNLNNNHFEKTDLSYSFTDSNNCSETITQTIQILKKPIFSINVELLNNGKYAVNLSTKNQNIKNEFLNFNWFLDNQIKHDSILEEFEFNEGGIKKIILKTYNQKEECFGIDSVVIDLGTLSISDVRNQNTLIYPNPFIGILNIDNKLNTIDKIEIYNSEGKELRSEFIQNSNTIDLNFLPNGIYICKLIGAQNIYSIRLIKN